MKKVSVLLFFIIASFQLNAQSKVGTIDVEYILSQMPGLKDASNKAQVYSEDLNAQLQLKITKYQEQIRIYQSTEASLSETDKKSKQQELVSLEQDIQKFQQNSNSLVQIKQNELLRPLYSIINDALQTVAEEGMFTQIFTINENLVFIEPRLDVTFLVMTKMGLPLPTKEGEK